MMMHAQVQHETPKSSKTAVSIALLFWCFLLIFPDLVSGQIVLPGPGIINSIAGSGVSGYSGNGGPATSAKLDGPQSVIVDSAGNLYIADTQNNVIRKVVFSTGIISTVAGNNTAGYSGDGGVATSAEINGPRGIAVDALGGIYIADTNNNVIRKVNSAGIISTVAGNGTAGYTGDGGAATSAELNAPAYLAVDLSNNIYITDTNDEVIREVNASTGKINTVAGGSGICSTHTDPVGDGCLAIHAVFDVPEGVAVDTLGNLYIADTGFSRIRKVTASTNIITTVAGNGTAGFSGDGGVATSAELLSPFGLAVDVAGNLYIADTGNQRVREVNAATGNISTIAGNGTSGFTGDGGTATSAELENPENIAVDNYGNTYTADPASNNVRSVGSSSAHIVLPGSGLINTVAGIGTAGYSGDGGSATSAKIHNPLAVTVDSFGNIYFADEANEVVRKVSAVTGIISTVAGSGTKGFSGDGGAATSAELNFPDGVAVDALGNVYIMDCNNYRVRKVAALTGIISTVAGNGTAGFSGDGGTATSAEIDLTNGLAIDSARNLYISDTNNNRIRKVTAAGIISTVAGNGTAGFSGDGGAATSAELNSPTGVIVDGAGNIYLGDYLNNRVREVTAAGIISTVAGNGTAGFSGDGGAATSAELNRIFQVAVDTSGNLYIVDQANSRIRKVTAGVISTVAGNGTAGYSGDGGAATSAELNGPTGVAVDAAANIYISDSSNNRIRAVGH